MMKLVTSVIISWCALILGSILLSSKAIAIITPEALWGVSRCFHADKELYSPINGAVALETGLIANIRFYGPTQVEEREGQRIYSEDRSNEDPLRNVVNLLFPSANGTFGTDSQANTNLGRYIVSPKTVALLLSFAHLARNHPEAITGILDSQATEITKSASAVKTLKRERSFLF